MRIGTTPTHEFVLPFDVEMIEVLEIIYFQNEKEVLRKAKQDCALTENIVTLKLTQEETFLFSDCSYVYVQIRIKTPGNDVLASDKMRVFVEECLSREVL